MPIHYPPAHPTLNIRSRIGLQSFGNPSASHVRGTDESHVPNFVYEGPLNFFVKIHRQDVEIARSLIDPHVCLLRVPKKRQKKQNGFEGSKGWNHPSHQNGGNSGISSISYWGGSQSAGTGQQMNPIDTEWPLILTPDNVSTTCALNPLNWYRKKGKSFGDPCMPITEAEWKTDGPEAFRLRGRKCKYLKWASHVQQFKLKSGSKRPIQRTPESGLLVLFPRRPWCYSPNWVCLGQLGWHTNRAIQQPMLGGFLLLG